MVASRCALFYLESVCAKGRLQKEPPRLATALYCDSCGYRTGASHHCPLCPQSFYELTWNEKLNKAGASLCGPRFSRPLQSCSSWFDSWLCSRAGAEAQSQDDSLAWPFSLV